VGHATSYFDKKIQNIKSLILRSFNQHQRLLIKMMISLCKKNTQSMINEIDWNQSDILHLRFLLLKME